MPEEEWKSLTEDLIDEHPLKVEEIIDVILKSWEDILITKIGGKLLIGKDIFPSPQIMGNYLHELIPIALEELLPGEWKKDTLKTDKDIEYLLDDQYSIEIKTSSSRNGIFGNRSYAQANNKTGKSKSGYYITINYDPFNKKATDVKPRIRRIRFGWLDYTDWIAQKAPSGQQARVDINSRDKKMKLIYDI